MSEVIERPSRVDEGPFYLEAGQAVARGGNAVVIGPPGPAMAAPVIAGMASRMAEGRHRLLVMAPQTTLDSLARMLRTSLPEGTSLVVAPRLAGAVRPLREDAADLLLTTPDITLALIQRSALKAQTLSGVALVQPEAWATSEAMEQVMAEVPSTAQRAVVTTDRGMAEELRERYLRKALVFQEEESPAPAAGARVAVTPWARRGNAVAEVLEVRDPERALVWCASAESAEAARDELPQGLPWEVEFTTSCQVGGQLVLAWDIPSPAQLAQLQEAEDLVLLAAPEAVPWLAARIDDYRYLRLAGAVDDQRDRAAAARREIAEMLSQGPEELSGELHILAPLFESHDASQVAAALYRLWHAGKQARSATPGESAPTEGSGARVWVNVGRKDGAGPADFVAVLVKEVGIERGQIGRIEIKDTFTLVELPVNLAETAARDLTGRTMRRRKVQARLDRGPAKRR